MKRFSTFLLALLLASTSRTAIAEVKTHISLGTQGVFWDVGSDQDRGVGWYLDGQYPIWSNFGLVAAYQKTHFDGFDLKDWQLGAKWHQPLFLAMAMDLEYRYVDLTKNAESSERVSGHRLGANLIISRGAWGARKSSWEAGFARTEYETATLNLYRAGLRHYLSKELSFALHYQNEGRDLHLIVLSLREER